MEMQIRREEKGLCYKCDEKYSIGHRCKLHELQVVVCQEESEPRTNADEEARSEGSKEGDRTVVELSVNSVIGLLSTKTMKLQGGIKGEGVIVMIDLRDREPLIISSHWSWFESWGWRWREQRAMG